MQFTNLNITTILIFVILGISICFLLYKFYKKQISFNNKFKLLSSNKYFYIKYIFLTLSFLILLFSIFGAKGGNSNPLSGALNKGIDITFVLDVSKSMNVADINYGNYNYTRLDIAKEAIAKYVVSHSEDRFGLVIFAGDAISTIPLTIDHDLFLTFLQNVDYRNLTVQGSDFEKALRLGIDRFDETDDRSKAIVFISDGGDSEDNINKTNFKNISQDIKSITYFTIGVGSEKGGKIILYRDDFGRINYQKYKGNYVISKLNERNLKDINNSLDGEYFHIENGDDLSKLDNKMDSLEKKAIGKNSSMQKSDLSRDISIISFILFMVFLILYIFEKGIRKY